MTIHREIPEGGWDQVKDSIRQRWADLSDQELEQARGNVEQLVGLIQEKTGEAREQVQSFFDDVAANGDSKCRQAAEAIKRGVAQTAEVPQHVAERMTDAARDGYSKTESVVRNRPVQSVAACFGAGMITGFVLGLLLVRSK